MGLFILGIFLGMMVTAFICSVGQNNREHEIWSEGYSAGLADGRGSREKE